MNGDDDVQKSKRGVPPLLVAVLLIVVALVIGFGLVWSFKIDAYDTTDTTLLVLGGALVLILVLGGLAAGYATLGLSTHDHALALPKGSVRAVLALGLLLVFVSVSTFLFSSLSGVPVGTKLDSLVDVTKETLDEIPDEFVVLKLPSRVDKDGVQLFNAKLFVRQRTEASEDLGKQIFTTIGTVLVTVIGFYFGSRSSADTSVRSSAPPREKPIQNPPPMPRAPPPAPPKIP